MEHDKSELIEYLLSLKEESIIKDKKYLDEVRQICKSLQLNKKNHFSKYINKMVGDFIDNTEEFQKIFEALDGEQKLNYIKKITSQIYEIINDNKKEYNLQKEKKIIYTEKEEIPENLIKNLQNAGYDIIVKPKNNLPEQKEKTKILNTYYIKNEYLDTINNKVNEICNKYHEDSTIHRHAQQIQQFCIEHNMSYPHYKDCSDLRDLSEWEEEEKSHRIEEWKYKKKKSRRIVDCNEEGRPFEASLRKIAWGESNKDEIWRIILELNQDRDFLMESFITPKGFTKLVYTIKNIYKKEYKSEESKKEYQIISNLLDIIVDYKTKSLEWAEGKQEENKKKEPTNYWFIGFNPENGTPYIPTLMMQSLADYKFDDEEKSELHWNANDIKNDEFETAFKPYKEEAYFKNLWNNLYGSIFLTKEEWSNYKNLLIEHIKQSNKIENTNQKMIFIIEKIQEDIKNEISPQDIILLSGAGCQFSRTQNMIKEYADAFYPEEDFSDFSIDIKQAHDMLGIELNEYSFSPLFSRKYIEEKIKTNGGIIIKNGPIYHTYLPMEHIGNKFNKNKNPQSLGEVFIQQAEKYKTAWKKVSAEIKECLMENLKNLNDKIAKAPLIKLEQETKKRTRRKRKDNEIKIEEKIEEKMAERIEEKIEEKIEIKHFKDKTETEKPKEVLTQNNSKREMLYIDHEREIEHVTKNPMCCQIM